MYDYSSVDYKTSRSYVTIICPVHGIFEQEANSHLQGKGCIKCKGLDTLTTDEFIKRSLQVHNNLYDYSLVKYKSLKDKVKIICKIHGEFEQIAGVHLNGFNCAECYNDRKRLTVEQFINKANIKHNNKYDYSLVDYKNNHTKVIIICPVHGEFIQSPGSHLYENGCPKCGHIISKPEVEICEFLKENNIYFEQSNRTLIKPYELDIVIHDKKIAIEFNGTYYHSDKFIKRNHKEFNTADEYHQMKSNKCNQIGYKLLHIFEKDYINNKKNELTKIKRYIN
jgi:G:T-mismatch repair DNA endonuclease (very short patch repair protein)